MRKRVLSGIFVALSLLSNVFATTVHADMPEPHYTSEERTGHLIAWLLIAGAMILVGMFTRRKKKET